MTPRDHGGGLDAAIARYGGARKDWLDLSTGINPVAYPLPDLAPDAWTALPDARAQNDLIDVARRFWQVPDGTDILAAPGSSCLITQMPRLASSGRVRIDAPTYNEHAAAFQAQGWQIAAEATDARVIVHPNNPTGAFWDGADDSDLLIIDESFCDIQPEQSLISRVTDGRTIVLKSFGKFWGLAGLRLGFAIGDPALISRLRDWLGPWPVSGPALSIGAQALSDPDWAKQTRIRLKTDAARLDQLMTNGGAQVKGGTSLFRLYTVDNAAKWQDQLAENHVWSRIFPYSKTWLRLGLPAPNRWDQLQAAL